MSPSDLAAMRERNAQSLRVLEFIQRDIAERPAQPRRRLHPWAEPLIEGEIAERELTQRGLRGWGRMMQ